VGAAGFVGVGTAVRVGVGVAVGVSVAVGVGAATMSGDRPDAGELATSAVVAALAAGVAGPLLGGPVLVAGVLGGPTAYVDPADEG
jgi:hypothetical protein